MLSESQPPRRKLAECLLKNGCGLYTHYRSLSVEYNCFPFLRFRTGEFRLSTRRYLRKFTSLNILGCSSEVNFDLEVRVLGAYSFERTTLSFAPHLTTFNSSYVLLLREVLLSLRPTPPPNSTVRVAFTVASIMHGKSRQGFSIFR